LFQAKAMSNFLDHRNGIFWTRQISRCDRTCISGLQARSAVVFRVPLMTEVSRMRDLISDYATESHFGRRSQVWFAIDQAYVYCANRFYKSPFCQIRWVCLREVLGLFGGKPSSYKENDGCYSHREFMLRNPPFGHGRLWGHDYSLTSYYTLS
jgi:hypothetical protein